MNNITLGLDAELFLKDHRGNNIPSCGLIGGTKQNPRPMVDMPAGFAVQEDNVTLEFNIPPAHSQEEWSKNISMALGYIYQELQEHSKGPFFMYPKAALEFDYDLLKTIPAAMVAGCDPDKNAYTGKFNISPSVYDMEGVRCAGAHIHVGYPSPSKIMNRKIVIAMDLLLGKYAQKNKEELLRNKYYGNRGAYRDKPYGVEYRVLSSEWLSDSHKITTIYKNALSAYYLAKEITLPKLISLVNVSV